MEKNSKSSREQKMVLSIYRGCGTYYKPNFLDLNSIKVCSTSFSTYSEIGGNKLCFYLKKYISYQKCSPIHRGLELT